MTLGRWPAARRWGWCALAGLLLLAVTPALASAQGTSCEDQDREVGALGFTGNRAFSGKELAPRVATTASDSWWSPGGTRRCLDSDELRLDVGRLRVFYRRHGYYSAAVDTTVTPDGPRSVRVTFAINEGEPVKIDTLRITGLDSLTGPIARVEDLDLRDGVVFDITRIQAAIDSIKTRLRNQGYPKADVAASYTVDTVAHRAVVDLGVLPEARAHFGTVRVFNDTVSGVQPRLGDATVRRLLAVQPGDLYSARGLAEAQRTLYQTDLFRSVELKVAPDSVQPKGDTLVLLDLFLRENYLRQINSEIGWAQLDCFKERTQYIDKNFLGEARRLELTVQLSKLGYGEPTRFGSGSLCASDIKNDLFSDKVNYFVGANLRLPSLLGFRTAPTFGLYSERRSEYQAYRRTTVVGGDASVTREVRPALPMRLGYALEYGRTEAQPALLCALFTACRIEERQGLTDKLRRLAVASAHLERPRTNDPVNPRFGTNLRLDFRASARELGSDRQLEFVKGLVDASFYHGLSTNLTFAARARVGTVLGRSLSFRDSIPFIPPEERLYAGGATSVRGFQQNQLGALIYVTDVPSITAIPATGDTVYFALDPNREDQRGIQTPIPVGGSSLIVLNFEMRVRSRFFPDLLQYVLFADAGDVWNRATALESQSSSHSASSLFLNGLKWTPGVGFRLVTPVGPFQVNVGYNPYLQPTGPIYYNSRLDAKGFAPLYCVTPGNTIPAVINPQTGLYEQDANHPCPGEFQPAQKSSFLSRLTLTFSIGPDF
jgi:outer membrane protein insertion porin family/translocation and assembly module TamA